MTKVMLDCGAYSAWSLGDRIELKDYIEYIRRNAQYLDCYISLDAIPGSAYQRELSRERIDQASEQSYRNQQNMKEAGLHPIPVFHQDDDFQWLRRYCEDQENYIALAPFEGAHHCIGWLDDCFRVLADYPQVRVHAMGTTSPLIAHRYNWTSMDSGTWFRQAGAALIPVPLLKDGQLDYALSPDIMSLGKYPRGLHIEDLDDYDLGRVNRWLAELGIELTQARTDYQIRQRIWIAYFKNLGLSSSTRIVFVSVFGKLRQVLLQCGAEYHLLSYYQLRDVPDTKLQNYVTGYL